jgi:hypothetical protein
MFGFRLRGFQQDPQGKGQLGIEHSQELSQQGTFEGSDWPDQYHLIPYCRTRTIHSQLTSFYFFSPFHSPIKIASRVSPGQVSKVKLKNLSSSPVGYKFKTNAPIKYSVKPVLGVLAPDESVKIFGKLYFCCPIRHLFTCIHLTARRGRKYKKNEKKRVACIYLSRQSLSQV